MKASMIKKTSNLESKKSNHLLNKIENIYLLFFII